ncbi:hypothetical protein COCSUDRAFT_42582 [Coccomyxa subellipsoidea C-169]|uniref:Uncharacterized protein n=1 Tax=Coccomyxa subellipsoidea (strain C-169) TaxID=574566 RepID=I0YUZ8_COCSC|nr:hypothetical protein COCSUDRAFT_42582 [Coccomyxa subellipsoidea C-169]EIE22217.1 hypothetical protein COCSUDRAFT_42582 [Coccomyxa subellipsoidea C-169]|eukprot:XP_005646761.1 hypothetical protein COCSUDRAFT_42582 [Coccomyxa subellipsoidea C-169]
MSTGAREVIVVLAHLALWSQLGVLTRISLDRLFADGCHGSFGVCLTSEGLQHHSLGAYFPDIASNMLGSYIMGLLAASATLNLPTRKPMAILPQKSPLQGVPELHIGVRTGFCGSLTTFASWEYSLVTGLVGGQGKQGGQWAEFLWGLVIGLQLSLASYVFGEQCALIVDRYLVPGGQDETDLEKIEDRERATVEAERRGELGGPDRGLNSDDFGAGPNSYSEQDGSDEITYVLQQKAAEEGTAAPVSSRQEPGEARNGVSWFRAFLQHDREKYRLQGKTNLVTAVLLALVLALFITLTIVDRGPSHAGRRAQWLAVLFGPFGCTLRWLLSKYNYKLPGHWKWLPAGTFAANMIACLVDYLVGGIGHRVGSLGYWATIVLYAIRTGFSGALSTVSTFVAEVHAQMMLIPEVLHGYTYSIGSLVTAALLGILVYGSMVWST